MGTRTHEGMLLSVLGAAIRQPDLRADYGLAALTDQELRALGDHVDRVETALDEVQRRRAFSQLVNHVELNLPAVDQLLAQIASLPGMGHAVHGGVETGSD